MYPKKKTNKKWCHTTKLNLLGEFKNNLKSASVPSVLQEDIFIAGMSNCAVIKMQIEIIHKL